MPYRLSAFADEISPDIQVQIDGLLENGVTYCAMRGVNSKNVMQLDDAEVERTKQQFFHRGVRFSCIGSPIGKTQITEPLEAELERLKRAAALARGFETKAIRIFSFYLPKGDEPAKHRTEVLRRMKALADLAGELGVNLIVENEKDLYGDIADRQLDVMKHIDAPHAKAIFDFSNFIQSGEETWSAWQKLKPFVAEFHIKDCRKSDGRICPAGQGDGKIREILQDAFRSGWKGYLTFEPHLSASGQFSGFTGPKLFKAAVDGLKGVLAEIDEA